MLYRKAKKEIEDWIDNGKVALLVLGARQVGKTYLIEETLKERNKKYVMINFLTDKKFVKIFDDAHLTSMEEFFSRLYFELDYQPENGTIFFLDEVQECKEALTYIKFLVKDGRYKYILSGSLLGVELNNLRSAPVGSVHSIDMYPMDFEEFLMNNGASKHLIDEVKECFDEKKEVDDYLHNKFLELFRKYMVVGGMPEAVQEYVSSKDLLKIRNIHNDIIKQYKIDFTKYEEKRKLELLKTYELMPSELNNKNKRFKYEHLKENSRFERYEESFNWLIDAGVALPVYNVTEPVMPLLINSKASLFKLFLSDVGLLSTMLGKETQKKILDNEDDINYGAGYENVACQELLAHGFETFYYLSKKHGEIDFIIEYKGRALPIEIKSGKTYNNHAALNNVLSCKEYNIPEAMVFCMDNVKVDGKITYYPMYMIMFVSNIFEGPFIIG